MKFFQGLRVNQGYHLLYGSKTRSNRSGLSMASTPERFRRAQAKILITFIDDINNPLYGFLLGDLFYRISSGFGIIFQHSDDFEPTSIVFEKVDFCKKCVFDDSYNIGETIDHFSKRPAKTSPKKFSYHH